MYSLKQKFKFTLDGPVKSIPCPVTVDGVRAVKIRWLYYQTSAPGEKEMQIRISELRGNGMEVSAGANARYLLCIPLDQNAFTTLTYEWGTYIIHWFWYVYNPLLTPFCLLIHWIICVALRI